MQFLTGGIIFWYVSMPEPPCSPRGQSFGQSCLSLRSGAARRRHRWAAAQRSEGFAYAHDRRGRGQRPDQRRRPHAQHIAAGGLAHDRRDGRHFGRAALSAAAARRRADAVWGGTRATGKNHAARTARGRPRDLRLEIRQGRRGVPRRGHGAGDRARRAGDPAHPKKLSAHRDQRADRHQRRAGARTPGVTPRLHHRAHSRRP